MLLITALDLVLVNPCEWRRRCKGMMGSVGCINLMGVGYRGLVLLVMINKALMMVVTTSTKKSPCRASRTTLSSRRINDSEDVPGTDDQEHMPLRWEGCGR
eukprot:GFYU01069381.1.p3 GENE.GFYU01069381.1~~GFYU01069381.1.p3  ORF type:complete len:101 (-),score=8.54 GFYU01069381.1:318-620(-)